MRTLVATTLLALLTASSPPVASSSMAPLAADRGATAQRAPRDAFGWPLPGFPIVLRRFDPPDTPYGRGHRGVDLGGAPGAQVLAAGAGIVVFAGLVAGVPVVSIDHPNGLRTTYEPVTATVTAGQAVARGQPVGVLRPGHPGCAAAACLHWGVRRGAQYLDPLWLLSPGPVRLLPAG